MFFHLRSAEANFAIEKQNISHGPCFTVFVQLLKQMFLG